MEPSARTSSEVYEHGRCCPLDRISQLPDPILHLILCNLLGKRNRQTQYMVQTRDVVQMTITLSKRWKNLWASLPCLVFSDYHEDDSYDGYLNIVPLVNAALLLRDSSDIHTFHLHWRTESWMDKDHHVNTWAEYVVRRNVKILTLDVNLEECIHEPMEFPRCIFTCPSLEKLKLEVYCVGFSLHTIETVRLSRLTKLHLYHLHSDRDSFGKLTFGCPVLEDLKMEDCDIDNLKISSDTLKSLSISGGGLTGTTIQISCPNLQSLDFFMNDVNRPKVVLENLSSLVQACIQINDCCGYRYGYGELQEPLNFISSRSKASELSAFCNLKELALLEYREDDNFEAVTYFLERSPNLEFLAITKKETHFFMEQKATCTRLIVCPHYKIRITFDCGVENERVIKLVKEFLDIKCDCSKLCDQQLLSA